MATPDENNKATRKAELIAGVFLALTVIVAFVFGGIHKMFFTVPQVAAKGAEIAKPGDLLFYLLAAGAMVSAAGVAFSRNIIYSALALLGTLLGTGALYIYLNADFLAVTQLLIYVGGVLVLILFAVMLTNRIEDRRHSNPMMGIFPGLGLLVAVLGVLGFVATRTPWLQAEQPLQVESTVSKIGNLFLGEYLLAFEVVSLLLLATLIGAVVVARKEIKE